MYSRASFINCEPIRKRSDCLFIVVVFLFVCLTMIGVIFHTTKLIFDFALI